MKYVTYDEATGEVRQWGTGIAPAGQASLAHGIVGSLADYCVDLATLTVVPKVPMTLTLPGDTPADGVTEAVVAGLPAGTVCDFTVSDRSYRLVIDDGTLEMAVFSPQTVAVRLWHPGFCHPTVSVRFV